MLNLFARQLLQKRNGFVDASGRYTTLLGVTASIVLHGSPDCLQVGQTIGVARDCAKQSTGQEAIDVGFVHGSICPHHARWHEKHLKRTLRNAVQRLLLDQGLYLLLTAIQKELPAFRGAHLRGRDVKSSHDLHQRRSVRGDDCGESPGSRCDTKPGNPVLLLTCSHQIGFQKLALHWRASLRRAQKQGWTTQLESPERSRQLFQPEASQLLELYQWISWLCPCMAQVSMIIFYL